MNLFRGRCFSVALGVTQLSGTPKGLPVDYHLADILFQPFGISDGGLYLVSESVSEELLPMSFAKLLNEFGYGELFPISSEGYTIIRGSVARA